MACNYPINAFRTRDGSIVFDEKHGYDIIRYLKIPCGMCVGCRMERARQWAVRCMHEASLYEENTFITLTYNDAHVTEELDYNDYQLFMKRLRKKFNERKIRFFMCGEYGENYGRPHFHACLFNISFSDRKYFKTSKAGSKIYTSEILNNLWKDSKGESMGFCTLGDVNINSAGYVARYITKKGLGRGHEEQYEIIDRETGEVGQKIKEFNKMSLKPGIGTGFYKKFRSDMFPEDICVVNGVATKPPKFYYKKLEKDDGFMYDEIAFNRERRALKNSSDNTVDRLEVKERVLISKIRNLKREMV